MSRPVSLVLAALVISSSLLSAQPRQLDTFSEVLDVLKDGWRVRAVIEYGKCKLLVDGEEQKAPEAIGGMDLSSYEYFAPQVTGNAQAYLVASETVLLNLPSRGYMYNYVKLNIYEDNTVTITARYLNPQSLEIVMDETFHGAISNGEDENGVRSFAQ
jgi:hypothetical protein